MANPENPTQIHMFMRYDKAQKIFEFRPAEGLDAVKFTESKMTELLRSLEGKAGMHKLMKFLVDQARKDPKGNWVEASSASVLDGQAMV